MIYALVHYPQIDARQIDRLRRKYDPQFHLIAPHITIMFPVSESIGEPNLASHVATILSSWEPFPIHLNGLRKSWDDYLFLTVQEGCEDIIRLHEELYTGLLSQYKRGDIGFAPHLTLGAFSGDLSGYSQALIEAQRLDLDYRCMLEKLHMVKINDERTQIVATKEFPL